MLGRVLVIILFSFFCLHSACTNPNFYGPYCNETCGPCFHGSCDANGTCCCNMTNYFGPQCNQACLDFNCTITCTCNDTQSCLSNETTCQENLWINNQQISFINGNIYTLGNLTISNSDVIFNSTSIWSHGCIYLINTSIIIDLQYVENFILLNSSSGCLVGSNFSISYLNQILVCQRFQNGNNSHSLFLIDEGISRLCLGVGPVLVPPGVYTPYWVAVVCGSCAMVVILTVIIVLTIHKAKKKLVYEEKEFAQPV